MLNNRQRLGQKGENLAALFIRDKGYNIIVRNYRCKIGEIDIIAKDNDTLVFIEVKTRSNLAFGSPATAITAKKQRQISRTAQNYLASKHLFNTPARFDVISIILPAGGENQIELITNAFDLCT